MEFQKISQEIFDATKANKEQFSNIFGDKLSEMFPAVVKDGEIDYKALLAELGEYVDSNERYELNWAGKAEAKRLANTDIVGRTLKYVPKESKNPDTTENLYIEGDNLEVLKLLRNSYYNKIKMIYIDPPYNTGNDFVYKDDFSVSDSENAESEGDIDEDGSRLIVNQRSNGKYHSNWLNMMYPRLRVSKDLLRDDGVIFISVDDNELDNLKKICNEVFGEENFIGNIIIKSNPRGSQSIEHLAQQHEYLLIYSKTIGLSDISGHELTDEMVSEYKFQFEDGNKYRLLGLRQRGGFWREIDRPSLYYPIYVDVNTGEISIEPNKRYSVEVLPIQPSSGEKGSWRWSKEKVVTSPMELMAKPIVRDGEETWDIYQKDPLYKNGEERRTKAKSIWDDKLINYQNGTKEIKSLFEKEVFNYSKPLFLIEQIVKMIGDKNSIVLDFFSGSASTAHTIMKLNAEDGGNRKYIMIQLPESCEEKSEAFKKGYNNICEIGKERIRRAGEKIVEDNKDKTDIQNLDIGFKVFRVEDTNIRWLSEAIKSDTVSYEQLTLKDKNMLDFNPGYTDVDVVYEVLLRHRDIPLSATVEQLTKIGKRTYIFANTVVVCLEEDISDTIIDKIASIEPLPTKVIFRDSAFGSDISLKENSMLRLEAQMKKHSGQEKRAYRVEFI